MLHTEIRKLLCGGGAGLIFQVGEAHLPGRDGYRQRKADEFAGIQFLLYKIFNHTGNPQIDFGEINEQIHGCDFYSLGGSDFFLYQIFFHVLPCDVLLIKQHQGGVRDDIPGGGAAGKGDSFAQIVQISLCADENIPDFLYRMKMEFIHPVILSDKADIYRPFFQSFHCLICGLAGNGYLNMRVFPCKKAQVRKKNIFAQSGAYSDGQMPHSQLLHLTQLFLTLADSLKCTFHLTEQKLTGFGQPYSSGRTQKQSRVQILFQPGYGFADSGLADEKLSRRTGNIPALGNRIKNMIQIQILFHSKSSCRPASPSGAVYTLRKPVFYNYIAFYKIIL